MTTFWVASILAVVVMDSIIGGRQPTPYRRISTLPVSDTDTGNDNDKTDARS